MSVSTEFQIQLPEGATQRTRVTAADRRADVEGKHKQIASLLEEVECDGLLVLGQENFCWLTSGGGPRTVLSPLETPALFYTADERWLVAANVDSQRVFDQEIDGLGFQLKEWPWHAGREPLLRELGRGRTVACDQPLDSYKPAGDLMRRLRRVITIYDQACYRALGQVLGHALEATCRTMSPEDTEREVAGQLAHRLLHRGAEPLAVGVAGDGRSRRYRQPGFTAEPVRHYCVLTATARKYGLCATASRSVAFGATDPAFQHEHDAASRISATYVASTWPDALPGEILNVGRRIYAVTGFEHDWLHATQGQVTGRAAIELPILPQTDELFESGWAITWSASVGAALSCDTFLITGEGPKIITAMEAWPLKRIKVQGATLVRPDVLVR